MDSIKGMAKKGWHPDKEGGVRNTIVCEADEAHSTLH
jgi:hypothetical protein